MFKIIISAEHGWETGRPLLRAESLGANLSPPTRCHQTRSQASPGPFPAGAEVGPDLLPILLWCLRVSPANPEGANPEESFRFPCSPQLMQAPVDTPTACPLERSPQPVGLATHGHGPDSPVHWARQPCWPLQMLTGDFPEAPIGAGPTNPS